MINTIKISELPAIIELFGAEIFALNQGGVTKNVTLDQIKLYTNPNLTEFTVKGTNFGRFQDGDLVPAHSTIQQRFEDAYTNAISPDWFYPVLFLAATPTTSNNREVGETLNLDFLTAFTQNDSGTLTFTTYTKNTVDLVSNLDTIVLNETEVDYQAYSGYLPGTGTKLNNLGQPENNPIQGGIVFSNVLSYRGYKAIFYGDASSKYVTSTDIRANLTKRLENSGNTFILNSGTTNVVFQLWLPAGKVLVSVIDLDALNANITSSYISESLQVEDAGGTLIIGTLYTMTQSVPYSENHRHQITII